MSYDCCGDDGRVAGDTFVDVLRGVHRYVHETTRGFFSFNTYYRSGLAAELGIVVFSIVPLLLILLIATGRILRRAENH